MTISVIVQSVIRVQFLNTKKRRIEMKDNFHIGFIVGILTAFFMAVIVSCSFTPLEAGASELGSSSWNPMYVKIVD